MISSDALAASTRMGVAQPFGDEEHDHWPAEQEADGVDHAVETADVDHARNPQERGGGKVIACDGQAVLNARQSAACRVEIRCGAGALGGPVGDAHGSCDEGQEHDDGGSAGLPGCGGAGRARQHAAQHEDRRGAHCLAFHETRNQHHGAAYHEDAGQDADAHRHAGQWAGEECGIECQGQDEARVDHAGDGEEQQAGAAAAAQQFLIFGMTHDSGNHAFGPAMRDAAAWLLPFCPGRFVYDVRVVPRRGRKPIQQPDTGFMSQQTDKISTRTLILGTLVVLLAMGVRATFGLFMQPMGLAHGWGRDVFSMAFALQNLVWGVACIFMGILADRYGSGRTIALGAVLYMLGMIGTRFATDEATLYLTAGVLVGLGQAGTTFPVILPVVAPPAGRSASSPWCLPGRH
ncbi:hypothetical protein G6F22_012640 [Rhizopus arrhizus]|nr:hypothetical protein G6F22_012640 [Rhizopus arrhizus]